jgi:RNA polymerase sigma-70 factor (ECF subfamily)
MNIDQTCLASAIGGDRAAAEALIESLWPDAYRIAWAALRDANAAEDAAQEACARAWRGLTSVRDSKRFAVWFYRIVVNECRRSRNSSRGDLRLDDNVAVVEEARNEERIDVRRAIDALPAPLRLAIVLRYYCDLTSVEIAAVVRASPITVRWRLMLAHRRMRTQLDSSEGNYADETVAFG